MDAWQAIDNPGEGFVPLDMTSQRVGGGYQVAAANSDHTLGWVLTDEHSPTANQLVSVSVIDHRWVGGRGIRTILHWNGGLRDRQRPTANRSLRSAW
jgi:hypothetical protein